MTKSNRPRNNRVKSTAPAIVESYRSGAYNGANVESLMEILRTKRPHKSKAEVKFSKVWLDTIPNMEIDGFGNRILVIPGDGDSIIWTSHVDTVHYDGGTQKIRLKNDVITLSKRSRSNCLGADDGAGIWLMLEMIAIGKPGIYIFHRAEECGGVGSNYVVQNMISLSERAKCVISLDRYGYDSVITDQCGMTASREFAESLAAALDIESLRPDDTGLFTDSANYADMIGECTNLSVGYFGHHTLNESLDLSFICAMRDSLIRMDSSKLVYSRFPGESDIEIVTRKYGHSTADNWDFSSDSWMKELSDSHMSSICNAGDSLYSSQEYDDYKPGDGESFESRFERETMTKVIEKYPELISQYLMDSGITIDEIYQTIHEITGHFPGE